MFLDHSLVVALCTGLLAGYVVLLEKLVGRFEFHARMPGDRFGQKLAGFFAGISE
jgi:zinc transporter ZupT